MTHPHLTLIGKRLTTPRSAAIAGILFAVMFSLSLLLIRSSLPSGLADISLWQAGGASRMKLALFLLPLTGIAFLWFMGVIRDRLGAYEDQFFSTVFFGSGLLFLAMVFAASAIAGAITISYESTPALASLAGVYHFGRTIMNQFFIIYAMRMAGVFVLSLGTIWLRTGLMPRWMSFITYLFALVLMLSTLITIWMVLVFPAWVFTVSIYILILNLRPHPPSAADGLTIQPPAGESRP